MRFLLKATIPVEEGNKVIRSGTIGEKLQQILNDQKPEAVYFAEVNGERTAFLFVNMLDSSQMPFFAEPWFLSFNAKVEFHPVMTPQDLQKGTQDIANIVKKYG